MRPGEGTPPTPKGAFPPTSANLHTGKFSMGDTRLEKLRELEQRLYAEMEEADAKTLPAIARQYRETLKDIEEIEGANGNDDEIADILQDREISGKAGAVR